MRALALFRFASVSLKRKSLILLFTRSHFVASDLLFRMLGSYSFFTIAAIASCIRSLSNSVSSMFFRALPVSPRRSSIVRITAL